jgi:filamentous hemagglutinin family protein
MLITAFGAAVSQMFASAQNKAIAQIIPKITPDNTLGSEHSTVTPQNQLVDRVDGGAIRGTNLFHSFQEFNIGEGRSAYFANPTGIENIISRVTGGNLSRILGTLGVLGKANLFLINPNGIIFGANAKLDVNGSFVASTASSVV